MAIIQINQSIVPFFSERMSFIKGLDPLGLQNTSDAAYTMLLPGLNNVTGRIRYYSFYSWLLDAYSRESGSTNPVQQRQFIRRGEYIIALLSQYAEDDQSSIPGSNYANKEVNSRQVKNHNLQEGTYNEDMSTTDTYWNYYSGAFGQYYLGSLRDIGIVAEREAQAGVYVRTSQKNNGVVSGEELAKAFDKNIKSERSKLFLNCIRKGYITEVQLKQLLPDFNMAKIPFRSAETVLLTKLLTQKDFPVRIEEEPSTFRRKSIRNILELLSVQKPSYFDDREFVYYCYEQNGKKEGKQDDCLMGWYYYQFNEFWQYACTSILNGVLNFLESQAGPNWRYMPEFVKEISEKIIVVLKSSKIIKTGNETVAGFLENMPADTNEYELFENTNVSQGILRIANALLLIARLYLNNKKELPALMMYAGKNNLNKDGEGVGYFYKKLALKMEKPLQEFLNGFILNDVLYRHQYVAFRKTGGGVLTTQKFILEDQHIRYIGNFDASYTAPRIGRLLSFMKDLKIIDADYSITSSGLTLLETLKMMND